MSSAAIRGRANVRGMSHEGEAPEGRARAYRTSSGLPRERLYGPASGAAPDAIGEPGAFPFTRGLHPSGYRGRLWTMRQYAGFGTAAESNRRYRYLLEQGTTGLSVAFDLPTQIGYDSDAPQAGGEVGRVGVAIDSLEDMETLLEGLPLDRVSTSMTINATASILLALYVAVARRRGIPEGALSGTIQNDILKEYVARGTYIFPPGPSLRLVTDVLAYGAAHVPKWNTISISGYHIREAGATAPQELAFTFANALEYVRAARQAGLDPDRFGERLSFFFACHSDFLEEVGKFRAARRLWARLMRERFGVENPKAQQLRFHVQTGGVTLTAQQPDNNVVRVALQALTAVLGGCQSLHTNAKDEALALPTEASARLALRTQQVIAFETGVADTVDPLGGAYAVEAATEAVENEALRVLDAIETKGGALRAIERGEIRVVGVNCFTEGEPSALVEGAHSVQKVDESAEREQIERLRAFRSRRGASEVEAALRGLRDALASGQNVMPPSIRAAHAGVTTGEWAGVLRDLYGDYRAPTGVAVSAAPAQDERLSGVRREVHKLAEALGRPPKILIGKPGLDGHSNGAEQIAVRARDAGMEVVYEGIRLTPAEIVQSARDEGVHVVGLSILSGSHGVLVVDVLEGLRRAGLGGVPVVVGGIIPDDDAAKLVEAGVRRVYTPKDFDLNSILGEIAHLVAEAGAPA